MVFYLHRVLVSLYSSIYFDIYGHPLAKLCINSYHPCRPTKLPFIALNSAVALKPVFDQYDPAMLERVRYDDTLAGVAAQQTSRPTYCDNRYYRAVANGGQGMQLKHFLLGQLSRVSMLTLCL